MAKNSIKHWCLYNKIFYYTVDSKNTQWNILHNFTGEDIDHVTSDLCFQNGDVSKSSEPIITFVQRKKLPVCVQKIEGLEINDQKHMICRYNSM